MAWQPIESAPKDFELFDVWSEKNGRIADCIEGLSTYGKVRGIVYQADYDSNGPVMELVKDATHWLRQAPPGEEKKQEPLSGVTWCNAEGVV